MLNAAQRRSAGRDEVAIALLAGPPAAAGVGPLELALTYASAAALVPRPEWDAGEFNRPDRVLLAALRRLRMLSPDQAGVAFVLLGGRQVCGIRPLLRSCEAGRRCVIARQSGVAYKMSKRGSPQTRSTRRGHSSFDS